ncbi:uncharacterized protein V1518DRAFT_177923 [Limtongia smithiae]|uniref:uncharacterized protein n=1 Tax=Limtongia smithiae TaxID=1125753 RepID=UPI0034D01E97
MPPPRRHKTELSQSRREQDCQRRQGKKLKKTASVPESEDDFLYFGSIEEEHGDRWTANDPPKAHRFYVRALQYYTTCLSKYTSSYDAAYNKCRLEFHMYQLFYDRTAPPSAPAHDNTEFASIALERRHDRAQTLVQILEDHEVALRIQQQSGVAAPPADLLFNMAQVRLCVAEEQYGADAYRAAFATFEQTWGLQEAELQAANIDYDVDKVMSTGSTPKDENEDEGEEEYATEIEPTTCTSLLETATAGLTCLIPIYTTSVSFSPSACTLTPADAEWAASAGAMCMRRIATLFAYDHELLYSKASAAQVEKATEAIKEAALVVARYVAVSGYPFLSTSACVPGENLGRLKAVWTAGPSSDDDGLDVLIPLLPVPADVGVATAEQRMSLRDILHRVPESFDRYLAQADMFTQFGLACASTAVAAEPSNPIGTDTMAWSALAQASQTLATAHVVLSRALAPTGTQGQLTLGTGSLITSKIAQMRLWNTRGDTELYRASLSRTSEAAAKNSAVLQRNAGVCYANAIKLAQGVAGNDVEVAEVSAEARIKSAVLSGDGAGVVCVPRWQEVLAQAIEDGVFAEDVVRGVVGG